MIVFYLFPTFFFFEIIKDNGKGPVNMFIVYLIGCYIAASLLRHRSFAPFARDNSLFMLAGAIALFAVIRNCHFHSKAINFLAQNIFAVYIGEVILRRLAIIHLPLGSLDGK